MVELLRAEMEAGALGLSSGLEYDPGSFSSPDELLELAREVAAHGGRYISHIRSEDQFFWEAIDEIVDVGRRAGLPVQVSHIKLAMTRWWGQADRLTARLDEARSSGVDITADIYPYRAWNSGFSWLSTLFPDRDLDRRDGARYVLRDMLSPEGILLPSYRPQPAYDGLTIAEIAEIRGSDPETTLMELLKAEIESGGGSPMLGLAMDEPDIEAIMAWPHTVIGSDGELAGPHPRGFGAFTRVSRPLRSRARSSQSRRGHSQDDLAFGAARRHRRARLHRGRPLRRSGPVRPRPCQRPSDRRGPSRPVRGDRKGVGQWSAGVRRRPGHRQPARSADSTSRPLILNPGYS